MDNELLTTGNNKAREHHVIIFDRRKSNESSY
jgi:hypothetical protein